MVTDLLQTDRLYLMTAISAIVVLICSCMLSLGPLAQDRAERIRAIRSVAIPFSVVAGGFSLLQLWLTETSERSLASHRIRDLEQALALLKKVTDFTELPTPITLAAIAIFLVIAWRSLRARREGRGAARWYERWSGRLARLKVYVTLVTAFTFFGGDVPDGIASVAARLKKDDAEMMGAYQDLAKSSEQAVTAAAVSEWLQMLNAQPLIAQTQAVVDIWRDQARALPPDTAAEWDRRFGHDDQLRQSSDAVQAAAAGQNYTVRSNDASQQPQWIDVALLCAECKDLPAQDIADELARFRAGEASSPPEELEAALTNTVDAFYGPTLGNLSDVVAGWTGLPSELFGLVVDPLLSDPVKDAIGERAKAVFDAALRGPAALKQELSGLHAALRTMLLPLRGPRLEGALTSYRAAADKELTRADDRKKEVAAQIAALDLKGTLRATVAKIAEKWGATELFPRNARLDADAKGLLASLTDAAASAAEPTRAAALAAIMDPLSSGTPPDGLTEVQRLSTLETLSRNMESSMDPAATFAGKVEQQVHMLTGADHSIDTLNVAAQQLAKRTLYKDPSSATDLAASELRELFPHLYPDHADDWTRERDNRALLALVSADTYTPREWLFQYLGWKAHQSEKESWQGDDTNEWGEVYLFQELARVVTTERVPAVSTEKLIDAANRAANEEERKYAELKAKRDADLAQQRARDKIIDEIRSRVEHPIEVR